MSAPALSVEQDPAAMNPSMEKKPCAASQGLLNDPIKPGGLENADIF
jgi:hypothetical protein